MTFRGRIPGEPDASRTSPWEETLSSEWEQMASVENRVFVCIWGMFTGSPHKQKIVWGWDGEVGDEPRKLGPESFEGGSQWLLLLAGSVIVLVIPNPYGQENKSILEMRKLRPSKMNFCTTCE